MSLWHMYNTEMLAWYQYANCAEWKGFSWATIGDIY